MHNQSLTLQATSTFIGLPPNSVGGELDPGGLEEAVLALADAAVSHRWRKRVTSSWSSIVFMCLVKITQEKKQDQKMYLIGKNNVMTKKNGAIEHKTKALLTCTLF